MTAENALAQDPADIGAMRQIARAAVQAGDGMRAIRMLLRLDRLQGTPAADAVYTEAVNAALQQAAGWLHELEAERAAAALEWLSDVVPYVEVRRLLTNAWLVLGRDADARRLQDSLPPADTGGAVALRSLADHREEFAVIGTIVIPVFRMAATLRRALDSVAAAIRCYREATGRMQARFHICVVDDGSGDETPAAAIEWGRRHPEVSLALISNNQNRGAGYARNVGVAAALGDYIWFLDADDWFLERHLLLTAQALDRHPEAGFVRTGIEFDAIDDDIRPAWRDAAEFTWPCNLCVRRTCHDRTGGFPEEQPFRPACADDVAYSRALRILFSGVRIAEKTAHYSLRPGNALDRQREEMVATDSPARAGRVPTAQFVAIELLTLRRLHALKTSRTAPAGPPPGKDEAGRRIAHGRALRQSNQGAEAAAAFTAALLADPASAEGWFERALQFYMAGSLAVAGDGFRRAALLQPTMIAAQVNLAAVLAAVGKHADGVPPLRLALAHQPAHANALSMLGQARLRAGDAHAAAALHARAMRLEPARPDFAIQHSHARVALGDAAGALAGARRGLAVSPADYDGHAAMAKALELAGQPAGALTAWERAIRCNAGFGEAFTRRSLLLLARRWGPPPVRPPGSRPGRRLQATSLGSNGRFGNQLLQYGLLRLYADRHDLDLEVPLWPGRLLYDRDDPLPGARLPHLAESEADFVGSLTGRNPAVYAGYDIDGYFCGDTTPLAPLKEHFRTLFRPGRGLAPFAALAEAQVRSRGRTVVAVHIRRGDFGWGRFWTAPEAWYLDWLGRVWPGLDDPVLYVASDDAACVQAFAAYRPLAAGDLGPPLEGAEYFTDFHALCTADLVAVSNSSFSFVATMLNRTARVFMRPDRSAQALVAYDPWAAPVLL